MRRLRKCNPVNFSADCALRCVPTSPACLRQFCEQVKRGSQARIVRRRRRGRTYPFRLQCSRKQPAGSAERTRKKARAIGSGIGGLAPTRYLLVNPAPPAFVIDWERARLAAPVFLVGAFDAHAFRVGLDVVREAVSALEPAGNDKEVRSRARSREPFGVVDDGMNAHDRTAFASAARARSHAGASHPPCSCSHAIRSRSASYREGAAAMR